MLKTLYERREFITLVSFFSYFTIGPFHPSRMFAGKARSPSLEWSNTRGRKQAIAEPNSQNVVAGFPQSRDGYQPIGVKHSGLNSTDGTSCLFHTLP